MRRSIALRCACYDDDRKDIPIFRRDCKALLSSCDANTIVLLPLRSPSIHLTMFFRSLLRGVGSRSKDPEFLRMTLAKFRFWDYKMEIGSYSVRTSVGHVFVPDKFVRNDKRLRPHYINKKILAIKSLKTCSKRWEGCRGAGDEHMAAISALYREIPPPGWGKGCCFTELGCCP